MILVGNQRGGARDLAVHLMKPENEHIAVHELRGFASDDLREALMEAEALSKGTRCRQFLFSMSFNPPGEERVATEDFERAIEEAESRLGLSGQPRAIVFHEKEGRRHAHAVWSRIDAETMKAVPLPFTKQKMQALSRDLYLEHGWKMPRGLAQSSERDPLNYTLAEWQQARRANRDPREIKAAIQDAWAISDSAAALAHALKERGFRLARGDRRSYVAVDHTGEPYAIARSANVKTKQVRERIGDPDTLPSLAETRIAIAEDMQRKLGGFDAELEAEKKERAEAIERERQALVERQRAQRQQQLADMALRQQAETKRRQARFSRSLAAIWDKLRGEERRIRELNELEALAALQRDRAQKDALIFRHLEERRLLSERVFEQQQAQAEQRQEVQRDTARYESLERDARAERLEEFMRKRREPQTLRPGRDRARAPER